MTGFSIRDQLPECFDVRVFAVGIVSGIPWKELLVALVEFCRVSNSIVRQFWFAEEVFQTLLCHFCRFGNLV